MNTTHSLAGQSEQEVKVNQPTNTRALSPHDKFVFKTSVDPDRQRFIEEEELSLLRDSDPAMYSPEMSFREYLDLHKSTNSKESGFKDDAEDALVYRVVKEDEREGGLLMYGDLAESVARGRVDDARVIIDNSELLQSRDRDGNNLLAISSFANQPNMTRFLLARGVDMYSVNNELENPRMIAERLGYTQVLRVLKKAPLLKNSE
jgi:hypothetical protein